MNLLHTFGVMYLLIMLQLPQDGNTALMYACKEGYLLIVKALLQAHPNVNVATKVHIII